MRGVKVWWRCMLVVQINRTGGRGLGGGECWRGSLDFLFYSNILFYLSCWERKPEWRRRRRRRRRRTKGRSRRT
jgi:hypothetical protein